MSESTHSTTEGRYATLMRNTTPLDASAGLVIQGLTVLALVHQPTRLALSLGVFVLLMPLNVLVTFVLFKRWGVGRTELLRTAINVPVAVLTNHFTGWPLPVWMWLPYVGLTYVGSPRGNWPLLLLMCASHAAIALHDGVPWLVPAAVVVFTVLARSLTNRRFAYMRALADRAEAQRAKLDQALAQLRREIAAREIAERELAQAHKLESVGRLASGIAHEMNTPLQFVSDSLTFLEEGTSELLASSCDRESLDYMRANMPEALRLVKEGLARVTAIVASLREFAHPGTSRAPLDVNRAVDAALTLTKHEYKYVADVSLALGDVPKVVASSGEINQVLVNLIVNAAQAIAERREHDPRRGKIVVATEREGAFVAIRVGDDGDGIDDGARDKIFEPFFTTKPVGRGTGQGLAIARAIVERHAGTISFTSRRGAGTTFVVRLPCGEVAKTEEAA